LILALSLLGMSNEGHRPLLGCEEATALAAKHFGIQVAQDGDRPSCKELNSYGDRNFYLRSGGVVPRFCAHPALSDTRMHYCALTAVSMQG
jgi:hypothetical protein